MKTTISCFLLNLIFIQVFATDYYSQGSVSPNVLSSWNTNPQGSGAIPVDFTTPGDKFIILSGHSMVTTAIWTVSSSGSMLKIEGGGTLQGNHIIQFAGTFQIDDGGSYIHSNSGTVDETAGNSIFGGTELFAADSHFEIRNWPGKDVGLPNGSAGILWGDLIINLQADISADALPWNWNLADGSSLTIKGDLDIRATFTNYSFHTELCFSAAGVQNIDIGGDFLMSGNKSKLSLKGVYTNGYVTMQVNGNILLRDMAQLNLGLKTTDANPYGLYELRFKGNFSAIDYAIMIYDSYNPAYLVANGNSPQTFICKWNFNRNFRVAEGATVNLGSALSTSALGVTLAILGTFYQNGNNITTYGKIETAGGIFNASGNLAILGNCTACSNLQGTYNDADNTWCTASGIKGRINFTNSNVSLDNREYSSLLSAGSSVTTSPGDIYFVSSTAVSYSNVMPVALICVEDSAVLSLDANSYIGGGGAKYQGKGGLLKIGSPDGITAAGNTTNGNVRTGLSKDYDFSGSNSFEYMGSSPQATGNGLPITIDGTLRINNNAGSGTSGVTLSQLTMVTGTIDLIEGKLATSPSNLITLHNTGSVNVPVWGTSYIVGPMKKIGSSPFRFPIGKGTNYAPLALAGTGNSTDEYVAEYFMANPSVIIGSPFDSPPINQVSTLEWWTVGGTAGTTPNKVTLEATTFSNAVLLSDLRILRWDGSGWKSEGNTAYSGVSSGPVTSNVISDFLAAGTPTPFTFGTISSNPDVLSVNLVVFNALKLTETKALVSWELSAFCSPTVKLEIQKADVSGNFIKIATVYGSETTRYYDYTDNQLKSGMNYYRLKMIDENGRISYSRTVAIMNGVNGLILTSVFPGIVNDVAALTVSSSKQQRVDLVIVDMQGRVMHRQRNIVAAGNSTIKLPTDRYAAGVYQIFGIASEGKTNIISFSKQ